MTNYPTQIATAIQDGIAVVTLNRPERRNAMTVGMVAQLRAELSRLGDDRDCRVIVLTGGGSAFCSGLELNEVHAAADRQQYPAVDRVALQEQFSAAILLIRRLRQPVIAAVHGAAIGAGFGLVLAADIRIVACSAKFLVGAVGIGLSAGECGISYHLPRVVGAGRAFEAMLTGRPIDADEALRIGLASRIVDKAELLDTALTTARTIAKHSAYSVKHTKQIMWPNLDAPSLEAAILLENATQTVGMLTQDFAEAVRAFTEKRAPTFHDK